MLNKRNDDYETLFLSYVDQYTVPFCWTWTGTKLKHKGVKVPGRFRMGSYVGEATGKEYLKYQQAQCWSYEHWNGAIPKGKVLSLKCGNSLCVNPEHLELRNREVKPEVVFKPGNNVKQEWWNKQPATQRMEAGRRLGEGRKRHREARGEN